MEYFVINAKRVNYEMSNMFIENKKSNGCGAWSSTKRVSYQCTKCDYFEFEQSSSQKVLEELRTLPLK